MLPEQRREVKRDIRRRKIAKKSTMTRTVRTHRQFTQPKSNYQIEYQPYEAWTLTTENGLALDLEMAEYVPVLICPEHGVQPVTGSHRYNTGHDDGETDVAACGYLDLDGVF